MHITLNIALETQAQAKEEGLGILVTVCDVEISLEVKTW